MDVSVSCCPFHFNLIQVHSNAPPSLCILHSSFCQHLSLSLSLSSNHAHFSLLSVTSYIPLLAPELLLSFLLFSFHFSIKSPSACKPRPCHHIHSSIFDHDKPQPFSRHQEQVNNKSTSPYNKQPSIQEQQTQSSIKATCVLLSSSQSSSAPAPWLTPTTS